jgi:hypothetical protein
MGDDRMAINGRRVLRPRVAHREAPVSARTLRRHWNLLSRVAEKVLSNGYAINRINAEPLAELVVTVRAIDRMLQELTRTSVTVDQRLGHLLATTLPAQATQIEGVGEQVHGLRAEVGERLAEFESHLRSIALAVNAPILPRWTKEQREAFRSGETDRMIRTGLREAIKL